MTRYDASYKGIGEMLAAPFMVEEMKRRAEKVKDVAEGIAPDAPPKGTGYKQSFRVEAGVRTTGTRRAFGRVVNDSPHAMAVEYGFGETPRHRVLGKAIEAAGGDA